MTEAQINILNNYRFAVKAVQAVQKQIDMLKIPGAPAGLHGINGNDGGTNDPTSAAIQREDGLMQTLVAKQEELAALTVEFEKIVERVADHRDQLVLRCYYALGWSDASIGREIDRTPRTAWNIRQKILHNTRWKI